MSTLRAGVLVVAVVPLAAASPDAALVDGKAADLATLIRVGHPVPDGFCLTTDAYRVFASAAGLRASIESALRGPDLSAAVDLALAARAIRAAVRSSCRPRGT